MTPTEVKTAREFNDDNQCPTFMCDRHFDQMFCMIRISVRDDIGEELLQYQIDFAVLLLVESEFSGKSVYFLFQGVQLREFVFKFK